MIGTTLDKYEVLQKVGEGGMATVYRGRHATLDRTVAIKVLHPHLSSSTRNRARFHREVKAIERLRHENILQIFDCSAMDVSDCYIVTEFVEGETLTSILARRGRFPSEVVAIIGMALCKALGYAHSCKVLHRDVKPDNIMVRADGTVKLMDFGIAQFLDESRVTMTGSLVGSPAFMSPEQAKEGDLDQRSDLFALGTVLFHLVTGHLPFSGSNPSLILKNVIEGNRMQVAELAPTMSASLADVIERLMATHAEDRFVTADDVHTNLLRCLTELQIDPVAPEWSLVEWTSEPDAYEAHLNAHLRSVLICEGRLLLGAGDHLAALRLLNRMLSIDEDNPEVLSLVQGLHTEGSPPKRRKRGFVLGLMVVLGAVGATALFMAARNKETADPIVSGLPVEARVSPDPLDWRDLSPVLPTVSPPTTAPAVPVAPPRVVPAGNPSPARVTPEKSPPVVEVGEVEAATVSPVLTTPAPPRPLGYGTVRINTGEDFADVYLGGGGHIGTTRSDITLSEGTHELVLKSSLYYEKTLQVTVAPDQREVVAVALLVLPTDVRFPASYPADCVVVLDGADQNTLSALGRRWRVERPDRPLHMGVRCPDGRLVERTLQNVPVPYFDFPGP